MMKGRFGIILIALASIQCSQRQTSVGGESNWLRACGNDRECGLGRCECGVCTRGCKSRSVCGVGGDCFGAAHSPLTERCSQELDAPGLCLAECRVGVACAPGLECIDNACVPQPPDTADAPEAGTHPANGGIAEDAASPKADDASVLQEAGGSPAGLLADASLSMGSTPDAGGSPAGLLADASLSMGSTPEAGADAAANLGFLPADPQPADAEIAEGQGCAFQYLGDWVVCEGSEYGVVERADASTMIDCMRECDRRSDCVAVNDFFWLGLDYAAFCDLLIDAACDEPMREESAEASGVKQYLKRCDNPELDERTKPISQWDADTIDFGYQVDPESECYFVALPFGQVCEDYGAPEFEGTRGQTLDECLLSCDADPECTAVADWQTTGVLEYECMTYVSSCESRQPTSDAVSQYVKTCQ